MDDGLSAFALRTTADRASYAVSYRDPGVERCRAGHIGDGSASAAQMRMRRTFFAARFSGVVFDVVPNAVSTIDFLRNNQLRSAAVETLFW
jgi:hypothetical protein